MCGVAAIANHPSSAVVSLSWQRWEDKEFLSFISGKNGMGVAT
jgi:hypothetical protein